MVGIISNTSALNAQSNLQRANLESQASISRLSSGNKISRAADDVAGLAVGTILKTNVSTLKAALSNTAQANSLLGVADGALKNIGEILQRQKALSSQATSGSLTAEARGFLNQEFQNLQQEIDRIADTTNFNGIKLIDGNLFAPSRLETDLSRGTRGQATFEITVNAAANDTIVLGGQTFTFVAAADANDPNEIAIGAAAADTAANIAAKINNITDVTDAVQAAGARLTASVSGAVVTLTSKQEGTTGNVTLVTTGTISAKLNGAATATAVSGSLVGGIDGGNALLAGSTTVSGTVGDALVAASPTLTGVTGNKDFLGTISGFEATYVSLDRMQAQITVGDFTYKTIITDSTPTAAATYRFTSEQEGGGYFDIQIAASGASVTDQDDATTFARRLDQAFSTLTFRQDRDISSYSPGGTVFNGTTSLGTLAGSSFDLVASNFTNVNIESIKVYEPIAGATTTTIEAVIDGEVYRNASVSTTLGSFNLTSVNNSNNILQFTIGSGNIDITASGSAEALQKSFESAFGIKNGGTGLAFQVGTSSTDNIGVQINSTRTQDIYQDDDGNYTAIDISTASNAQQASDILDNAISTVTALRANIGALQSRFDYAAANIESAIQNQDAARSTYLDTDVAAESTAFAQAQVRLQASISVLAQANQLPQNLLKLIG